MFQIKICGINTVKDALLAALAGADGIGLNFFAKSPRCVDLKMAQAIVERVPPNVQKVGIFVNAPADEIAQFVDLLKLDYVQLHGDEPPEYLPELGSTPVIRAFRCREDGVSPILEYLEACRGRKMPTALLVDAFRPGEYGGTGEVVDWKQLAEHRSALGEIPLILAGGLTPFNVEEAIGAVRPNAVDTASGVEAAPGNKNPMLVRAFVNAAKQAFEASGGPCPSDLDST